MGNDNYHGPTPGMWGYLHNNMITYVVDSGEGDNETLLVHQDTQRLNIALYLEDSYQFVSYNYAIISERRKQLQVLTLCPTSLSESIHSIDLASHGQFYED